MKNTALYRPLALRVKVLPHCSNGRTMRVEFPKRMLKFVAMEFVVHNDGQEIFFRESTLQDTKIHKVYIPKQGKCCRVCFSDDDAKNLIGDYNVYLDNETVILSKKDY